MDVVYIAQAGTKGPIYVAVSSETGLRRRVAGLQDHNHQAIRLLHILQGSVELDVHLRDRLAAHHIRGRWFKAAALADLPPDLPHHERLERAEQIRAAFDRIIALEAP